MGGQSRSWKRDGIRAATQRSRDGRACARCLREVPAQDSDEFLEWEALGDGTQVVCPDCLKPQEQQAIDEDAMAMAAKVRENRLRRMAERQGYRLRKSRRRDVRAVDYGLYWIVDPSNNTFATGHDTGMDLDDVEQWLIRS
ncbi:hypothetical protein [Actinomadura sp. 9N215]|uniref:hypothetical protein n=1 Tax=Actinomadura sp. 9N215 TaxID=3375150 RepID=UPI0037B483BA